MCMIQGTFDGGYLVTVELGSVFLSGVLYHSTRNMSYPAPLASHDDLVKQPSLFWSTLQKFHSALGTKIPVYVRKRLDLNFVFVEVTKKGGYDKVVKEKKWEEIRSIFNFSATIACSSYALKKNYLRFLYHFEQLYLFQLHQPSLAPTGFKAIGTFDAKYGFGYSVSVKVGLDKLKGLIYDPENPYTAISPYPQRQYQKSRRRRRKSRRGDPNYPKLRRSGYNFFFAEKHSSLKFLYSGRERELTKLIGESWNNLTQEQKMVYKGYALKDKDRFEREMMEYEEKQDGAVR